MLREHYEVKREQYFSADLSSRLVTSLDEWFPDHYRIADIACRQAVRRAQHITRDDFDLDVRDFFRGTREYGGQTTTGLISEACNDELETVLERDEELSSQLPS